MCHQKISKPMHQTMRRVVNGALLIRRHHHHHSPAMVVVVQVVKIVLLDLKFKTKYKNCQIKDNSAAYLE